MTLIEVTQLGISSTGVPFADAIYVGNKINTAIKFYAVHVICLSPTPFYSFCSFVLDTKSEWTRIQLGEFKEETELEFRPPLCTR